MLTVVLIDRPTKSLQPIGPCYLQKYIYDRGRVRCAKYGNILIDAANINISQIDFGHSCIQNLTGGVYDSFITFILTTHNYTQPLAFMAAGDVNIKVNNNQYAAFGHRTIKIYDHFAATYLEFNLLTDSGLTRNLRMGILDLHFLTGHMPGCIVRLKK